MLRSIKNFLDLSKIVLQEDDIKSAISKASSRLSETVLSTITSPSLLNSNSQPTGNAPFVYNAYLSNNIKNIMAHFAEQRIAEVEKQPVDSAPTIYGLTSKISTQHDLESAWCRYWIHELKTAFCYHRKLWEYGFVLQVLFEHGMFGKTGLGLACGNELLPSYLVSRGCDITAGDKPFDKDDTSREVWASTSQYTKSKESLYYAHLVERTFFDDKFTLAYADMNDLPSKFYESFDFCWSMCAMEHLGSIRHGLDFLKNSLKLLRKGGISVHTTEFNLLSNEATLDNWGAVLFTKTNLTSLSDEIIQAGGRLYPFDFNPGNDFFDRYIDMPPYPHQNVSGINMPLPSIALCPHIKVLADGFPFTCVGVIIQKQ